jgi:hypothetical protein
MKTLFERLKPSVRQKLDENEEAYGYSIKRIKEALNNKFHFGELTISEVQDLYTFSDEHVFKVSSWDLMYGGNLFEKLNDEK